LHEDPARARRVGRRYAELAAIIGRSDELEAVREDLRTARELGAEDPGFAEEAEQLAERAARLEAELEELLAPRDPDDGRDVILEIKAGAGGEESALFAAEMLRMYRQYATARGWVLEVLDLTESELGGIKDVTVSIRSRGAVAPAEGVWA